MRANTFPRSRSAHSDTLSARGIWRDAQDEREEFQRRIRERLTPDTPSSWRSRSAVPSSPASTVPYQDQPAVPPPSEDSAASTIQYPEAASSSGATQGSFGSTIGRRERSVEKTNKREAEVQTTSPQKTSRSSVELPIRRDDDTDKDEDSDEDAMTT